MSMMKLITFCDFRTKWMGNQGHSRLFEK